MAELAKETTDDRQGKMLMLTEFSLLSQLKDMKGVVHCRDFFKVKFHQFSPYQFSVSGETVMKKNNEKEVVERKKP